MKFAEAVMDTITRAKDEAGNYRALASATGVHYSTLYKWIAGKREPTLDGIGAIMDYLGVTLSTSPSSAGATTCPELEAEVARLRAENKRLELELARAGGQVDLLKEQLAEAQAGRQAEMPAERKAAG